MIEHRWYLTEGIKSVYSYFQEASGNPVIAWPTGCHAKGTRILMFDGSTKAVEDIVIGDLIMGPDSKPRKVLNLAHGRELMTRVVPVKGDPFVVNNNHILSLKRTQEKISRSIVNKIENVSIAEYKLKSKWFKHTRKLWRTGVDFFNQQNLSLPPYFLGLFLGDGNYSHSNISLTTMDKPIADYWCETVKSYGDLIRIYNNGSKANTYYITNNSIGTNISYILKSLNLKGKTAKDKFIPHQYKVSSRCERLKILAGLIDTDGSMTCNGYDYISKSKQLATDVCFVARSLGFAAYTKACTKSDQNGTIGIYWRVSLSGDFSELPLLLDYKKTTLRKQKKNVCVTGFAIELLPEDDFYGFALDGDHLYLTDDFTIHHNTGKSFFIAQFVREVLAQWPNQRFLVLTHVKELVENNAKRLREAWPLAPMGVYSAGLQSRDIFQPIIFGGVASVKNCVEQFGHRDIIFIDEAHLLSPETDTMYQQVILQLKQINPRLKVIGLTATPFRIGQGLITDGGLFTHVCHDLTQYEMFNRLIDEGFLCNLIPRPTQTQLDLSNVSLNRGEYSQASLQKAVDKKDITYAALSEACTFGQDRQSWLTFCSGVEHAEHCAEMLQSWGIPSAAVHSKLSDEQRDNRIGAFKSGDLRCLTNYGVLTTGFDHPPIDFIIMLRPTLSPGLWVQMLGRGTRPSLPTNKRNCLVLDFARNTIRLGPINQPMIPRKKGETVGDVPVKICDTCGAYNHARVTHCTNCGTAFIFAIKITKKADTTELIYRSDAPIVEYFDVDRAYYQKHKTKQGKSTIKVSYYCGLRMFNEFVLLEHEGYGKHRARDWWRQRHALDPPATVDEALLHIAQLKTPRKLRVWINKTYPEVLSCEF